MDKSNRKVRVLEISHGLAPGGIESFLLNVFENIDRERIDIDFAVACNGKQFYEDRVLEQGARVYHTSDLDGIKNMIKHFFKLLKILKEEGPFDVVHSHIDFFNGVNLMAAWIARVPIRISHSHSTNSVGGKSEKPPKIVKVYRIFMRSLILAFSNVRAGCSKEANKYMYGKSSVNSTILFNGVDISVFSSNYFTDELMKEININKFNNNFITIGRMSEAKNSLFIVKIIKELVKLNKNIHLYWIGKGPKEKEVEKLIKEDNLEKNITLLGERRDIPELLSIMDFMIFPSKWEGLPVTLIEAQASNLPCFISDTITEEVNLGLCTVISINNNEKVWATKINDYILNSNYKSNVDKEKLEMFNIKNVCKTVEEIYTA